MSKQIYAAKPANTVKFNVKITSEGPFITFGHLKNGNLDAQENEMIMLDQSNGNIKREIPAILQIASFGHVPVFIQGSAELNLSIKVLRSPGSGFTYIARFKGANAFKQSIPYLMDSLYRVSSERLQAMNAEGLKQYFSERGKKVLGLFNKAKITKPQEISLLLRYQRTLQAIVAGAFNTVHESNPTGISNALLAEYNFKGTDLNRICQADMLSDYIQTILTWRSHPSDSRLKKLELLLADKNQFIIQNYVMEEYRRMFLPKGLTPELEAFYTKLKPACTDLKTQKALEKFYPYHVNLMPGKPAPDFALSDYNGKTVRISDFKGKLLVIDCWGTWCSPCMYNLPLFEKVADGYKDSTDIVFMTMALEAKDQASWRSYIKEHNMEKGIHLHIPNDETDPIWIFLRTIYQLDTYPRYIVIDRQGNFIDTHLDYPQFPAFKEKIDQWYKEKR